MMMMMVMVTMMVNVCDDDCYLVMKVILVKEVMSCDVSPVAMFLPHDASMLICLNIFIDFFYVNICGALITAKKYDNICCQKHRHRRNVTRHHFFD